MNRGRALLALEILVFTGLVTLSALLLFSLQKTMLSGIHTLRDSFLGRLESQTGTKIVYKSMSPSLFGVIDLRSVAIYNASQENSTPFISIDRIRLRYSFFDVITGRGVHAFLSLHAERPVIELDKKIVLNLQKETLPQPAEKVPEESEAESPEIIFNQSAFIENVREAILALPDNFNVRVTKGRVSASLGEHNFAMRSFSLNARASKGNLEFKADWSGDAQIKTSGGAPLLFSVPGGAEGSFSSSLSRGDFKLSFPAVSTDVFTMRRTSFLAVWTNENLVLRKIDDYEPYDAIVLINFNNGSFYARFSAENFSPAGLITLRGDAEPYNKYLALQLKGSCVFEKPANEGLVYSAFFSGNMGRFASEKIGLFELNATGTEKQLLLHKFKLSLARGSVDAQGSIRFNPFVPSGTIHWNRFFFSKEADPQFSSYITGTMHIAGSPHLIRVFSPLIDIGGTEFSLFNVEALPTAEEWNISLSALKGNLNVGAEAAVQIGSAVQVESGAQVESGVQVEAAQIQTESAARTEAGVQTEAGTQPKNAAQIKAGARFEKANKRLNLNLDINDISLKDMINLTALAAPIPRENTALNALGNDIIFTSGAVLSTNFKELSYEIPLLKASYNGVKNINAEAYLRGSEKRTEMLFCRIGSEKRIDISAFADYENLKNISINITSNIDEKKFETKGSIIDLKEILLTSSYGLSGSAGISEDGSVRAALRANSVELPFFNLPAYLSMNTAINWNSFDNWLVQLRTVDLRLSRAESMDSTIHIAGSINQNRALISEIVFGGTDAPLSGDAFFNFKEEKQTDAEVSPSMRITLGAPGDIERFNVEGRRHGDSLDLSVDASEFKLYRFFSTANLMILSGKFTFGFESINNFYSSFDIKNLRGRNGATYWTASTKGSFSSDKFEIGESLLNYSNLTIKAPYISMNSSTGVMDSALHISGPPLSNFLVEFAIHADYTKIDSWFKIKTALEELEGKIYLTAASFLSEDSPSYTFDFEKKDTLIKISSEQDEMFNAQIDTTGLFFANLNAPLAIQGTITGTVTENTIDANASDLLFDLKKLQKIIPSNFPLITTGGVMLADISIQGNITDPQFYGSAQAFGAKFIVPEYIPVEIGPAPASAILTGDSIIIEPVITPVEQGEAMIECAFHFDRWLPKNFEISITALPEKPLPFAVNIPPVVAQGFVSGTLLLNMEDDIINISGNLTGNDTKISLSSILEEEEKEAVNPNIIVQTNLSITAEKRVEFLWPREQVPILRANIDSGAAIVIKSDTLNDRFSLTGDIELRGGEIYYFQRSFYIKEGRLSFGEGVGIFEPRLSAVAESRDHNADGPVRIMIIVDDQPLEYFTPRIVSEPALSQVEILSMLGNTLIGTPDEETNQLNMQGALTSATDILAQFYLYRRLEQALRDLLHIDIFSARTQSLQNFVVQSLVPDTQTTDEANSQMNNRIGNYFDNTTLLAGKYIGKGSDMFVQAMVATRYDKNKIEMGGITFEVDVGIELTSPLLNVRCDIRPSHLNSLWVEDTSVTLQKSWHFQ
ncbi:MAG: translocation/assembly module TamB [Spirochaetaceae bacterium]|jgi:hypothetical protein|nr:translocation/assembly module TamB [Spirochaetaceae bacterium]